MQRWIHVDFKCLAPTPAALINAISSWAEEGATGVVFEWENTFPYPGFEGALRKEAYTPEEVTEILDHCRGLGLKAIPLVQTFGHVEWCLSHEKYASLREFEETPGQIRACDDRSWEVVKAWVDALIEAHHDAPYIHLGADEAWRLKEIDRPDCSARREGAAAVFLRHMRPLIDQVLAAGKRPIIWADMVLKHPAALDDFPRELVFCDWLYSQTAEYAPQVHAWGLGQINSQNYGDVPAESKALFEKYWRMDAEDFPARFYQFSYLPFLRDRGFDVIVGPATLYAGNALAGTHLPNARANSRGWLNAAHRFGATGALNTCWAVRGALRETSRTGHRAFLLQARDVANMPADEAVSAACWEKIAGDSAAEVAKAVDILAPPLSVLERTAPLAFDTESRTHRCVPFDERLTKATEELADLADDDLQVGKHLAARERAAAAEAALTPLAESSDEAEAWLLGAREVAIRADLWLAVRAKGRGMAQVGATRRVARTADLAERVRRQADRVEGFMKGRYQPEELKIVREDRYEGVLRLIAKLTE